MKSYIFLITLMTAGSAGAEFYTSVDKNKNKHFGDMLRTEHKDNTSRLMQNNINSIPGNNANNPREMVISAAKPRNNFIKVSENRKIKLSKSECKKAVSKYMESKACFDKCRNKNGSINRAKCPDCISVTRPSCHLNVK